MVQNASVIAFGISELLRENQQNFLLKEDLVRFNCSSKSLDFKILVS